MTRRGLRAIGRGVRGDWDSPPLARPYHTAQRVYHNLVEVRLGESPAIERERVRDSGVVRWYAEQTLIVSVLLHRAGAALEQRFRGLLRLFPLEKSDLLLYMLYFDLVALAQQCQVLAVDFFDRREQGVAEATHLSSEL